MEKEQATETTHRQNRAQALEMGSLIDISQTAHEVGFGFPVVVTAAAWQKCIEVPAEGQGVETVDWRVRKMLEMLSVCHEIFGYPNPLYFPNVIRSKSKLYIEGELKAGCSLDEFGDPVLTISLPEED